VLWRKTRIRPCMKPWSGEHAARQIRRHHHRVGNHIVHATGVTAYLNSIRMP
jgi:hypothetical protein